MTQPQTGLDYDVVVIGGGIGGLSAAWKLRNRKVLVLEANDRVGGRIRSEKRGDYWLNFGAHLFGDDSSPAGALANELGLTRKPIPGDRAGLAFRGKVLAGITPEMYPFRLPLSLGGRLSLIKMGLKLKSGVKRLLAVQKNIPGENADARRARQIAFDNKRTLRDLVGKLHPEVDLMLRTITERTAAAPEKMAAGYGLTSFGQVWSKHSFGFNLFGGSAGMPLEIAKRLPVPPLLGAVVTEVKVLENSVEVTFLQDGDEKTVRASEAIVAAPADVAAKIIRGLPQDTHDALGQVRYGPFLSVAVLTTEAGPMPYDDIYALATPGMAFGVFFNQASSLRNNAERKPGGSLMLFRGAEGAREMMERSDEEIREAFLSDLFKLYPQCKGIVAEAIVQRWPKGAPYAFCGRADIQSALTKPLGRVHLAGDYLEFPCMDAAISTGQLAAQRVEERLSRQS